MVRSIALFMCVLVFSPACSSTAPYRNGPVPFDQSIESLTAQITEQIPVPAGDGAARPSVALFEFLTLEKKEALIGKLLAEELISALFKTKRFTIVERHQIEAAMRELKFSASELTDPASAVRLGKLIGADVVVIGTVADFGDQIRVNGRLISVEAASVSAVAQVNIRVDTQLRNFLGGGKTRTRNERILNL